MDQSHVLNICRRIEENKATEEEICTLRDLALQALRAAPPTTKPSGEAVVLVPTEVPGQVIQWSRDNYGIRSGHKAMWAMLLDVATNPTSPYTMRLEPSPSPTKEPK